jgi:hypothetical protein
MDSTFERIIKCVPKSYSVLDVGAGGLTGENTSQALYDKFLAKYHGINVKDTQDIDIFKMRNPGADVYHQNFFDTQEHEKYGCIVLDMNIENNLLNWSEKGLDFVKKRLARNGYLINYIMTDPSYGDANSQKLLAEHRQSWWKSWAVPDLVEKLMSLPHLRLIALEREERRPEIYWTLLRYES